MSDRRWNSFVFAPVLIPDPAVHLCYAPLTHLMERQHISILSTFGATIGIFREVKTFNLKNIEAIYRIFHG